MLPNPFPILSAHNKENTFVDNCNCMKDTTLDVLMNPNLMMNHDHIGGDCRKSMLCEKTTRKIKQQQEKYIPGKTIIGSTIHVPRKQEQRKMMHVTTLNVPRSHTKMMSRIVEHMIGSHNIWEQGTTPTLPNNLNGITTNLPTNDKQHTTNDKENVPNDMTKYLPTKENVGPISYAASYGLQSMN